MGILFFFLVIYEDLLKIWWNEDGGCGFRCELEMEDGGSGFGSETGDE